MTIILAACRPKPTSVPVLPATPTQVRSVVVLPSLIPTHTVTPQPTNTVTASPTATQIVCNTGSSITVETIPSQLLGEALRFQVYLPPCYDPSLSGGYPLLIMLHGQNGKDDQWINLGLTTSSDSMIVHETIPAMVMVFPWERLYLQDWRESRYASVLSTELVPFLLQEYNIAPERELHAIGGLSRGASWALTVGLSNPQYFNVVGGHSLPTFGGEIRKLPGWLDGFPADSPPKLYFDVGELDRYKHFLDAFIEALEKEDVPFIYQINPGAHELSYWQEHVTDYLTWYGENLTQAP